jgi:hypothetical protein
MIVSGIQSVLDIVQMDIPDIKTGIKQSYYRVTIKSEDRHLDFSLNREFAEKSKVMENLKKYTDANYCELTFDISSFSVMVENRNRKVFNVRIMEMHPTNLEIKKPLDKKI